MKITMYELLGMVKDGKIPKKIKYRNNIFEYCGGLGDYRPDNITKYHGNYLFHYLFEEEVNFLNDEVEILEEEKKIPEKLGTYTITDETISGMRKTLNTMINIDIIGTINEIIDYLKSKGE